MVIRNETFLKDNVPINNISIFPDALGFSLFRSIEKKSLQISEDALERASDEEKIVLVNSVIKSIKVDEKTASSLQEIKKSLDIKLNNKK